MEKKAMCDWIWNHNKTRKLQVSSLMGIFVRYYDSNMRAMRQERAYSVVGVYEKNNNHTLPDEVILFTSDIQSECVKFVDSITPNTAKAPLHNIDALVNRFLMWPLPESVRSDECVTMRGYPSRIGTNLLTADEARQMFEYVLGANE